MESEETKTEAPYTDKTSGRLKEMYAAQEAERIADYPYAEPNPSDASED